MHSKTSLKFHILPPPPSAGTQTVSPPLCLPHHTPTASLAIQITVHRHNQSLLSPKPKYPFFVYHGNFLQFTNQYFPTTPNHLIHHQFNSSRETQYKFKCKTNPCFPFPMDFSIRVSMHHQTQLYFHEEESFHQH